MTSSKFKLKSGPKELVTPSTGMIEKIAIEFAGVYYDTARSQGLHSKHKNARSYARAYFEKFIPNAIKHCMEILNNPKTPVDQKMMIYDELMKRANDPEARALFPSETEHDKHLNFNLPEGFFEKYFPEIVDEKYLEKKRMN